MYYIYFIQAADGPIKIGHAKHPIDRLKTLQSANASGLTLLAAFTGYVKDEIALHKKYAAARIRGEWFNPTEELLLETQSIGLPKSMRMLEE